MTFAKLFTLQEAQDTLHSVKPLLAELVELKKTLDQKGYDVYRHQYFGGMGPNGQKVFPNEMERLVEIIQTLNQDGIEVKDINRGLIDFPHERQNGEVVYLCFLHGEDRIEYWHSLEGGFAGRKPLEEL